MRLIRLDDVLDVVVKEGRVFKITSQFQPSLVHMSTSDPIIVDREMACFTNQCWIMCSILSWWGDRSTGRWLYVNLWKGPPKIKKKLFFNYYNYKGMLGKPKQLVTRPLLIIHHSFSANLKEQDYVLLYRLNDHYST